MNTSTPHYALPGYEDDPELVFFDLDTISKSLGICRRSLDNYIAEGRLKSVRFGRRRKVSLQSLKQFVQSDGADQPPQDLVLVGGDELDDGWD